jgi:predicted branched-subunit amino acid permease
MSKKIFTNMFLTYALQGSKSMRKHWPTIAIWAIATGVAMGQVLNPWLATLMALCAYAGSAQLVVLPLILINSPIWLILLAPLIVNIRFVVFSASMHRYLYKFKLWQKLLLGYINGDMIFIEFSNKFNAPATSKSNYLRQIYFYIGAALTNYFIWQCLNIIGIFMAQFIPKDWGLAFVGSLALAPIILPFVMQLSYGVITLLACLLALVFHELPYRLPMLIAMFSGMLMHFLHQTYLSKSSR